MSIFSHLTQWQEFAQAPVSILELRCFDEEDILWLVRTSDTNRSGQEDGLLEYIRTCFI